ncbi:TPA: Rpn family recombination-promoting nuclease/putative transposase [Klebsiella aerogenes]|nr:Rpn family recombination-promoting nuclease/putative transposase [Klebsiella aerogenes]HDS6533898.1 Rpn family recombination-promoting nuclease/putative transposase [Klebsiella aerogenes]HDS7500293.1 Rpn family recombination-promoting nuclease/putative transposase [Klebsiella aerogenes]HDT0787989.1 Rpn family recombination-promoting nuclease/putative transposase [Klebsiella aerogenes]HDT2317257.1 Rpn family recombination-promoting nuclease/putative transposase [Klebsiella aerogenes]
MKKQNSTPTPHDATFRQFLANPDVARDFLDIHLPSELRAICDLDSLKLESGTFVEDDLHQYASDILWSMKTVSGDDGYIHLLLEHYSSAVKHMAFRQLRYAVAVMQRHIDAGHKELPLVIPILFCQGHRSPYPYSTNWLDGFSNPELAGNIYTRGFPLVDMTAIFMRMLAEHPPQYGDELMTIAQQHEQKDIEKGKLEGWLERKREVARNMLRNGFDSKAVMAITGLTTDEIAQIRH